MQQLFESVTPRGISLVATKLGMLLQDYLSRLEAAKASGTILKPVNYIIIMDVVSGKL